jgi:hypothetical protein
VKAHRVTVTVTDFWWSKQDSLNPPIDHMLTWCNENAELDAWYWDFHTDDLTRIWLEFSDESVAIMFSLKFN